MPRSVRLSALLGLVLLLTGCGTATKKTPARPAAGTPSQMQAAASPFASPDAALAVGGVLSPPGSAAERCSASTWRTGDQPADDHGKRQIVVVGALNLRGGPGMDCELVGSLGFGTLVTPIGRTVQLERFTWRHVSTPQGDGFVVVGALQDLPENEPALIPVLMYHRIEEDAGELFVTPAAFEAQLRWLRDHGYAAMTPADLVAVLDHGLPLPARPIIISIDDYWVPAPDFIRLMETYGFRGTYFLPNGAQLSSEEIAAMAKQGQVCGHTVTHPYLDGLTAEAQSREVAENKQWLEGIIGQPVTCFAYPFGHSNDATVTALQTAGFQIAFSAHGGQGHLEWLDRWHVPRLEVSGLWSLDEFAGIMTDIQDRT